MKKLLMTFLAFAFIASNAFDASAAGHKKAEKNMYPYYLDTTQNLNPMYHKKGMDYPKYPHYLNTTQNLK